MSRPPLLLAAHVLLHMMRHPGRPVTSETMAAWGGTHAVVIRRTFAGLRAAGIVASEKGHGGGWRLAKPPEHISLAAVRRALVAATTEAPSEARPTCLIERAIDDALREANAAAQEILEQRLEALTLAELNGSVRRLHELDPSITGPLA